jgi:hypothetical protein
VTVALTSYLFELRRHGVVWFSADGYFIDSDIVVLGDLVEPATRTVSRLAASASGLRLVERDDRRLLVVAQSGVVLLELPAQRRPRATANAAA